MKALEVIWISFQMCSPNPRHNWVGFVEFILTAWLIQLIGTLGKHSSYFVPLDLCVMKNLLNFYQVLVICGES